MAVEWSQVLPAGLAAAIAGWFGTIGAQWLKGRDERATARIEADAQIAEHRDQLAIDLLAAARADIAGLRLQLEMAGGQIDQLQPLARRASYLDEALEHIAVLITPGLDAEALEPIVRRAKAFLKRMERLAEARGTARNEAQVRASAAHLTTDKQQT